VDYIEITFQVQPDTIDAELLIAELAIVGFESFQDTNSAIQAYIPENLYNQQVKNSIAERTRTQSNIQYKEKKIKDRNWNEEWEKNYSPVLIGGRVYIRAPFHKRHENIKYEIIIEPKMSFGTAHHETTGLVIELMLGEYMNDKTILDMGCGTGVLAIFAELSGAKRILAVDNDSWAYNNTIENCEKNKCKNIHVELGDIDKLGNDKYDLILANINRNILLKDLGSYTKHLVVNGVMILSGFYKEDLQVIQMEAVTYGLKLDKYLQRNNWLAARFTF